jgi:hypothetical protein
MGGMTVAKPRRILWTGRPVEKPKPKVKPKAKSDLPESKCPECNTYYGDDPYALEYPRPWKHYGFWVEYSDQKYTFRTYDKLPIDWEEGCPFCGSRDMQGDYNWVECKCGSGFFKVVTARDYKYYVDMVDYWKDREKC